MRAARADIADAIGIKVLRDADLQRSIGYLRPLSSRDRAIPRRDDDRRPSFLSSICCIINSVKLAVTLILRVLVI